MTTFEKSVFTLSIPALITSIKSLGNLTLFKVVRSFLVLVLLFFSSAIIIGLLFVLLKKHNTSNIRAYVYIINIIIIYIIIYNN